MDSDTYITKDADKNDVDAVQKVSIQASNIISGTESEQVVHESLTATSRFSSKKVWKNCVFLYHMHINVFKIINSSITRTSKRV